MKSRLRREADIAVRVPRWMMTNLDWKTVASDFAFDGGLREICVYRSTFADWQHVLDRLRAVTPPPTFELGGIPAALPQQVAEVFRRSRRQSALLRVAVGQSVLHCHFFRENEIKFDLEPATVTNMAQVDALTAFMAMLGDATGKAVALTMDGGDEESAIFRYLPDQKRIHWVPLKW